MKRNKKYINKVFNIINFSRLNFRCYKSYIYIKIYKEKKIIWILNYKLKNFLIPVFNLKKKNQ